MSNGWGEYHLHTAKQGLRDARRMRIEVSVHGGRTIDPDVASAVDALRDRRPGQIEAVPNHASTMFMLLSLARVLYALALWLAKPEAGRGLL